MLTIYHKRHTSTIIERQKSYSTKFGWVAPSSKNFVVICPQMSNDVSKWRPFRKGEVIVRNKLPVFLKYHKKWGMPIHHQHLYSGIKMCLFAVYAKAYNIYYVFVVRISILCHCFVQRRATGIWIGVLSRYQRLSFSFPGSRIFSDCSDHLVLHIDHVYRSYTRT